MTPLDKIINNFGLYVVHGILAIIFVSPFIGFAVYAYFKPLIALYSLLGVGIVYLIGRIFVYFFGMIE